MLSSHDDSKMGVREQYGGMARDMKLTDIIPDLPSARAGPRTAKEG